LHAQNTNMSQPTGKKTGSVKGGPTKKNTEESLGDRSTPSGSKPESESKDETSSNGDKKETKTEETPPPPKPQSAGASIRDAATKILNLAMKSEWTAMDPAMKAVEKAVAAGGDETNSSPLAGVNDPVSNMQVFSMSFEFKIILFYSIHLG
jgi:hypothetical protein